jgi:hypothetical protein
MSKALNDIMEFDVVVRSDGEGNVEPLPGLHAPEVWAQLDDTMESYTGYYTVSPGWNLLKGFTNQEGNFLTEFLHESEYIGGGLERHIRENAGHYCVVGVYDDSEDSPSSWAVAFREL